MAKKKKKINIEMERINQRVKKGLQDLDLFYKIHGNEIRHGHPSKKHNTDNDPQELSIE